MRAKLSIINYLFNPGIFQSKQLSIRRGFTLIELLVVISIIGILATLILARFGAAEKSGRDTRRRSDINQYRTALENYSIKSNGLYPSYTSFVDASANPGLCSVLGTAYISDCVQDPRQDGTTYFYRYRSDGNGSGNITATQYMLFAYFENIGTDPYLYICSSGKIGQKTSAPTGTSDCW
ncbi:MAG: type II secretion system protein [bacterium]|nr:type II secretion system protein [bacterium]